MDAFKDRLSQRAFDTGRPGLEHQCRGRELDEREVAFADALMTIYATGEHDFSAVARQLTEKGVVAPRSGRSDWTEALLSEELAATNKELDAAYEAHGYGA
ncbi:hypothetical protein JYP52_05560 [Nitratireductor aquibiodomus]|uniref:recombinase-like helix-turn-helix domain-containing protein n=1 Tax=Nitratireductor aquibiodomus TaxID=204799 RepID=UPI0019D38A89|nr:recombinase-like helix-turn-helix domain-containing protein [Nitratireductor aquibiodomus]MBN7760596.1 hypothetical protein [Nitratireductor aquibiodomus]